MKKYKNTLWQIFTAFFKIGLFTFGGGYAMISLIQEEFVSKRKIITDDELIDLVGIAEATPGPIAINCATYIGYKNNKLLGAIIATLGVILPSFIIIYIISNFVNQFLAIDIVSKAFKGIKIGVSILIVMAGIKMLKTIKKNVLSFFLIISTIIAMLIINYFSINFSSIYLIIIGAILGLVVYQLINHQKKEVIK